MAFIRTGERSENFRENQFALRPSGSLRGAGVLPTFMGPGASSAGTTSIGIGFVMSSSNIAPLPNDLALLVVETSGGDTPSTPVGYNHVAGSPFITTADANGTRLNIYYQYAPRDPIPSSIAFTNSGGDHAIGQSLMFRNVYIDKANGPYVISATDTGSTTTTHTWAGGDTPCDNCLVLLIASDAEDSSAQQYNDALTSEGNLTNVLYPTELRTANGNGGGWARWLATKTAKGPIGTVTATRPVAARSYLVAIAIEPGFALPA